MRSPELVWPYGDVAGGGLTAEFALVGGDAGVEGDVHLVNQAIHCRGRFGDLLLLALDAPAAVVTDILWVPDLKEKYSGYALPPRYSFVTPPVRLGCADRLHSWDRCDMRANFTNWRGEGKVCRAKKKKRTAVVG